MTVMPDFVYVLCNFDVTKGVGYKCELRVTSLTHIASWERGFFKMPCHRDLYKVLSFSDPHFIKLQDS